MELSSSPGSSKRAKALGSVNQVVSCSVDGCNSDLSRCREYHRRHKVCELHSKTPKVTIGGREQRFCQQCSRFHSLIEFDEGKRSCRKRLDGHNRRRRKPQSEFFNRASALFQFDQKGPRLVSFSNPHMPQSTTVASAWAGDVKIEDNTMLFNSPFTYIDKHNLSTRSSAHSHKGTLNPFESSLNKDHIVPVASAVCQPFLDRNSSSGNHGMTHKVFPGRLDQNSDGARSFLSSAPTKTQDASSSHIMYPEHVSLSQSMLQNLHFSGTGQYPFVRGMETKPVASDLDSNVGNNTTTLHFQGVYQNGHDGSSGSGSQQTLSFRWELD